MFPTVAPDALTHEDLVLCATHRLARHLRQGHDRARAAAGLARWRPLQALTPAQWLEARTTRALLAGAIDAAAAPRLMLAPVQEQLLWERVIGADLEGSAAGALFDLEGLAATAQEANALMEVWGVGAEPAGPETRRFLVWRAEFRRRCAEAGWLEPARAAAWRIDGLAGAADPWPARVVFAGFDRYTPQERRLAEALGAAGVEVVELQGDAGPAGPAAVAVQADRAAECRAAAAWAARRLGQIPDARLAVVVPELGALRDTLADALDAALQPAAFAPAGAEMPRRHNFSLGAPLARQALVATALDLLRLAAAPHAVALADFGALVLRRFWSADETEADARARLDARLREDVSPTASLQRLIRYARREGDRGAPVLRLVGHLQAVARLAGEQPARQWPSAWGAACRRLLAAAGWPGERGLSSHEFQARLAFDEELDGLARLDPVLGPVAAGEAVARLSTLCRDRVFQPETEGVPAVQVMGPLEAAGAAFDGLWVMGMNDHLWPPAPRPNPLLPAEAQRRVRSPAASAEVEADFARAIHGRLLASAPEVVFSWARRDGERDLRPSPLLAGLPAEECWAPAPALAATVPAAPVEMLEDHRAPPLAPGEHLAGGARLLQTQALCPAWAFHRYRLGAAPLAEPVEGLDARARGDLLHRVLELFWRERGQDDLHALMVEHALEAEVARVAALAVGEANAARDEPLPPRFLALEAARLTALVLEWLDLEAARPVPFTVVARERDEEVAIAGLTVRLRVDRMDALPDGRRLILDYKTGGTAGARAWDKERLTEPQLPLYAAFAPEGPAVAGIAFARVVADKAAFAGLAAEGGLLPGVKGAEDWPTQVGLWRGRLESLAREIGEGWAAVQFESEHDLAWCELRPILRLPEALACREASEEDEP